MSASTDPALLGPLVLNGPAVERDSRVREKNNSPAPVEADWLALARRDSEVITTSEMNFYDELNRRSA